MEEEGGPSLIQTTQSGYEKRRQLQRVAGQAWVPAVVQVERQLVGEPVVAVAQRLAVGWLEAWADVEAQVEKPVSKGHRQGLPGEVICPW